MNCAAVSRVTWHVVRRVTRSAICAHASKGQELVWGEREGMRFHRRARLIRMIAAGTLLIMYNVHSRSEKGRIVQKPVKRQAWASGALNITLPSPHCSRAGCPRTTVRAAEVPPELSGTGDVPACMRYAHIARQTGVQQIPPCHLITNMLELSNMHVHDRTVHDTRTCKAHVTLDPNKRTYS